jgi:hypothetical protein
MAPVQDSVGPSAIDRDIYMRWHDDLTIAKQESARTRRHTQYINGAIEQLHVEYITGKKEPAAKPDDDSWRMEPSEKIASNLCSLSGRRSTSRVPDHSGYVVDNFPQYSRPLAC